MCKNLNLLLSFFLLILFRLIFRVLICYELFSAFRPRGSPFGLADLFFKEAPPFHYYTFLNFLCVSFMNADRTLYFVAASVFRSLVKERPGPVSRLKSQTLFKSRTRKSQFYARSNFLEQANEKRY